MLTALHYHYLRITMFFFVVVVFFFSYVIYGLCLCSNTIKTFFNISACRPVCDSCHQDHLQYHVSHIPPAVHVCCYWCTVI